MRAVMERYTSGSLPEFSGQGRASRIPHASGLTKIFLNYEYEFKIDDVVQEGVF